MLYADWGIPSSRPLFLGDASPLQNCAVNDLRKSANKVTVLSSKMK